METKIMKYLRKYLKEIVCLVLGLTIMIIGKTVSDSSGIKKQQNIQNTEKNDSASNTTQYDNDGAFFISYYEKQITNFVSKIDGVSDVNVIVYIDSLNDVIPAENINDKQEHITEKDSNGGTRDTTSSSIIKDYVIVKDKDGNESIVIISNKMPKVSGVAICAKGADSNVVKEKIINAVKSTYGLENCEIFVCS